MRTKLSMARARGSASPLPIAPLPVTARIYSVTSRPRSCCALRTSAFPPAGPPAVLMAGRCRLPRAWYCRLSRGVAVELPADLLLLAAKTRWVLLQPLALCAHQAGSVVLSHLLL